MQFWIEKWVGRRLRELDRWEVLRFCYKSGFLLVRGFALFDGVFRKKINVLKNGLALSWYAVLLV
jgi:hypothetical protein